MHMRAHWNRSANPYCKLSKMWKRILSPHRFNNAVTTLSNFNVPLTSKEIPTIDMNEERLRFEETFPEYVSSLLPNFRDPCLSDVIQQNKMAVEYNVPFGKKNRGLSTVLTYKLLAPSDQIGPRQMHLARIMGWNMELLQASLVVLDDIQDHSFTRRGKLCWFRQEGIGLRAINDGNTFYYGIFTILKKYFSEKRYYVPVIELFNEVATRTALGQNLDSWGHKPKHFTIERYRTISAYKTAFYSFYLPVVVGIHMAGLPHLAEREDVRHILLQMGHFYQIQNDFLDCYGDPAVTGKVGTDIPECKCTWLVVRAMEIANDEQKKIIEENYGQANENCVEAVRNIFHQVGLKNMFYLYEMEVIDEILQLINQLEDQQLQHVMLVILNFIYKREK